MQKPQLSNDLTVLVKSLKKGFLETEFRDVSTGLDSQDAVAEIKHDVQLRRERERD